ncbi:hypothetical protein LTR78_010084 [Recurvomyces mirabilis]|uniref:PAC domain-containing protein n=1 Tax=Recurvomyces mirabilis TaxID=574656 RepID=A0AAE0TR54_9PEZI|nr:hypothetical protein LTR78_010084 [Recurvomyces mirabilis]KAK5159810.1 hypothetical protein LTS14_001915 [Recurvomyces mirabilis]
MNVAQARAARRQTPILPFLRRKTKTDRDTLSRNSSIATSQAQSNKTPTAQHWQPAAEPARPDEPDTEQITVQAGALDLAQEPDGTATQPDELDFAPEPEVYPEQVEEVMSAPRSISPPSVFDHVDTRGQQHQHQQHYTPPTTVNNNPGSGSGEDEPSYDLKPPPPSATHDNVEALSDRLFSADHLDAIIRDHNHAARLTRFLNQYRPQQADTLARYMETKKAIAAIQYANAIAEQIPPNQGRPRYVAATLDQRFEAKSAEIVEDLVEEALPAYITHRLVTLVTDTLVKEITGNSAPVMRELIPSLAEVYCVTDPSLPDNPIVYASEEFYNTTQYGREYTIGRNCRFLQGPKSSNATVRRMIEAIQSGQEICETILNYRRDGSPFMNLLMLAPLYDNKGQVRYFLGCQIDVSSLIENGRGLESFSGLLAQDRSESRFGGRDRSAHNALNELGQMLSEEEGRMVGSGSGRARSFASAEGGKSGAQAQQQQQYQSSSTATPQRRGKRILLGMEETATERTLWPSAALGPSGRLPGVYQNYLLVRPYPSLRITFTSPALRIPGLLQTKFLERIGGPQHIREGILDAMAHGTSVTAKVSWLTHSNEAGKRDSAMVGKPRWIHCTPLLGSDERVGVWMVVMVENEEVTGSLNRHQQRDQQGMGMSSEDVGGRLGGSIGSGNGNGVVSPRYQEDRNKLYSEYLRREGRPDTADSGMGVGSRAGSQREVGSHQQREGPAERERERREVDDQFRDF